MSKQLTTVHLNNNNTHVSSESPNRERNYGHCKVDKSSASLPQGASAAYYMLDRGYNLMTFEGPGQGGVICKQKIPFRYDWEKIVTHIVDYTLTNRTNKIDPNRMALMGISMGGYLAASKSSNPFTLRNPTLLKSHTHITTTHIKYKIPYAVNVCYV